MTPLIISLMVFAAVTAAVGLLAFVFRDQGPQTATRLDLLVGKRTRQQDQANDILRRSAFDSDKKSLLQALTPKFLSPQKLFEQADCHIKPGTLTGIGLLLGVVAATVTVVAKLPWWLAPVNALVMFSLPWIWLYLKRAKRLKRFMAQMPDG